MDGRVTCRFATLSLLETLWVRRVALRVQVGRRNFLKLRAANRHRKDKTFIEVNPGWARGRARPDRSSNARWRGGTAG